MKASRALLVGLPLLAGTPIQATSPPENVPWRAYEEPIFPLQLFSTLINEGFASVVFTFDENGRVTDRVALHASHPAFVVAVFDVTRRWEIDTTKLPRHERRETVHYTFKRDHVVITRTQRDAFKALFTPYGDEKGTAFNTCREDELDAPLEIRASVAPEFPAALKNRHVRGSGDPFAQIS